MAPLTAFESTAVVMATTPSPPEPSSTSLRSVFLAPDNTLSLLDQRLLPSSLTFISCSTASAAADAIRDMVVRGAPAIGAAAALGLASHLLLLPKPPSTSSELLALLRVEAATLDAARPTAVNLTDATAHLLRVARGAEEDGASGEEATARVIQAAKQYVVDDLTGNYAMGKLGAEAVLQAVAHARGLDHTAASSFSSKLRVLTHCNTGSLATAGHGTALGVIRSLAERGMLEEAIATETRPYNQGARLTVFELVHDGLPARLIADSMAAPLMAAGRVDAVVVGADRIAANGDSANKIGTYMLSVVAKHHGIPFFIAAPLTTVDTALAHGGLIPIEERNHNELTHSSMWLRGVEPQRVVAEGVKCWNPAFDVAPAQLITGIITEVGVAYPERGVIDMKAFIEKKKQEDEEEDAVLVDMVNYETPVGFKALDAQSVLGYVATIAPLRGILGGSGEADWTAQEVGDGNLNFVYIIHGPGGSFVLKQALPYVRCVGEEWPLPCSRATYEAEVLIEERKYCPEHTPQVYHAEETMAVVAMEYIRPPALVLRKGLIAGNSYPKMAAQMGYFCASTLFNTSLLALTTAEHRLRNARLCGNVAMCRLTEQVIFTEPYTDASNNRHTSPQLDGAARLLRTDAALKNEVSALKAIFCESAQAMLHGDLHTGSVMVDHASGVLKVIDPEFGFYGPMGFDLGAFLANLLLNYFSLDGREDKEGNHAQSKQRAWLESCIADFWRSFVTSFSLLFTRGTLTGDAFPISAYPTDEMLVSPRQSYLRGVLADALGFAGCKMIRRIVGIAHVEDMEEIEDKDTRALCERRALHMGRWLVMRRRDIACIDEVVKMAQETRQRVEFTISEE